MHDIGQTSLQIYFLRERGLSNPSFLGCPSMPSIAIHFYFIQFL